MIDVSTPELALLYLQKFVTKVHNMDFITDEEITAAFDALTTLDLAK
jgi:hypothetical protein